MCFVLLMDHCEVINSQHSVSESAHQRRAGVKHSQIRSLLIPQPKEKYPHEPRFSHQCVSVCERAKERETMHRKERVMANLKYRYGPKLAPLGK